MRLLLLSLVLTAIFAAAPTQADAKARHYRRPHLAGRAVFEKNLRADALPAPSGNLHIASLNAHEELKTNIFNSDGSYNNDAIRDISHLLRCRRTGEERSVDPRLLTVLSHIYDHFGQRRIEILSGFRNQRNTESYHFKGAATDIRILGVGIKTLRAFAESLDTGGMGIGLYPRSGFVHVDVRPLPSYRWVDWSRSQPNSPDKRPPRGWKKKLES